MSSKRGASRPKPTGRRSAAPEMSVSELLQAGLQQLQIADAPSLNAQLLRYLALLAKWNPGAGLVAAASPAQWVVRHLLDSLALLPAVHDSAELLDVGSGGGLPGLPLALARPELRVTLLDSRRKATTFTRQAAVELGLANVKVICERVEKYRPPSPPALIVARAVAPLPRLLSLLSALPAPGGKLLVPLGNAPSPLPPPAGWQCSYQPLQVPFAPSPRGLFCAVRS